MKRLGYIIAILVGTASSALAQTPHLNPTSFLLIDPGSGNQLTLSPGTLTGNRIFTFPDASGTLAVSGSVVISTNSTLSGDGTIGNPLGLNLANANTWTATQTLPVTAAQGDALIASTNAGTTTIDAARIGAGLTDAQVNDNLTINGGTVDATPIGATTPSTGDFTTLTGTTITGTALPSGSTSTDLVTSNAGALETRTIASLGGSIAVSTDATLTGDGTTGDPLGIDLTNANTWTATQTLPVTAAQGDALIASTNAGTTTIDAARIGAGLTDAQVNDNLTINGGTVDATPIGATTPSTGAFTTITGTALPSGSTSTDLVTSNAGALETRTIASLGGSIAVSTDATLTGDGTTGDPLGLNVANANTWTATQTLPVTAAQGDALIASTNAGTTTIDAARIGGGLTDAQVNDNLTINGGTVDATPIGGTTPSTGAFTTLGASGTTTLEGATNLGNGDAGDVVTINTGGGTDLVISEDGVDRSSGSIETFAIDNSGAGDVSVLINSATAVPNSRIIVNEGHWTSQGTAPSVATNGALQSSTVSATSTDVAGQVSATDNTTGGTGVMTVTFSSVYASDPIIVVTPSNAASFNAGFFVSNVTTTSFDINVITTANDGTTVYSYTYQVIEND